MYIHAMVNGGHLGLGSGKRKKEAKAFGGLHIIWSWD
jgi:hypothetical protein